MHRVREPGGPAIATTPLRPFGTRRDWETVRRAVRARLRNKFPGSRPEDLDDAAGYAIADLLDYWVHARNSISPDPDRNYRYAVKRGAWMGAQFLGQSVATYAASDSIEDLAEQGIEPLDHNGPEDIVVDVEERRAIFRLVEELDDERAGWLKGFLEGRTARDEAAERKVSHPAVLKRRTRLLDGLRESAVQAELA